MAICIHACVYVQATTACRCDCVHACVYVQYTGLCMHMCMCIHQSFDKIFSLAQFKLYLSQFIFKTAHAYIGNCSQNKGLMNHLLWHIAG